MADNKITFSFDAKNKDEIFRLLKDLQKETSVLGQGGSDNLNKMTKELEHLYSQAKQIDSLSKVFDQLGVRLRDTEKQWLKTFTGGQAGSVIEGIKKQMSDLGGHIQSVKDKMVDASKTIQDPSGTTPKAGLQQTAAAANQLNTLLDVERKLTDTLEKLTMAITGGGVAGAPVPGGAAGGGAGGAGGGGGEPPGGFWGKMRGIFGPGGGGLTPANMMSLAIPGMMASGAYKTAQFWYNTYNPMAEQSRDLTMQQRQYQAAQDIMQGDITRSMMREAGVGRAARMTSGHWWGAGESAAGMLQGLKDSLIAVTTGRDIHAYRAQMNRQRYEDVDRQLFSFAGEASQLAIGEGRQRRVQEQMLGRQAVLSGMELSSGMGFGRETSRPIAEALALYRGRGVTRADEGYLRLSRDFVGMSPQMIQQLIRTGGSAAYMGAAFSTTAGLGTTDAAARSTLTESIADLAAPYGSTFDMSGMAATAAVATARGREATAASMGITGAMPTGLNTDISRGVAAGMRAADQNTRNAGSYQHTAQLSRLMAMGLPMPVAMAFIDKGLHTNLAARKQVVDYANQLAVSKGQKPQYTVSGLESQLSESQSRVFGAIGAAIGQENVDLYQKITGGDITAEWAYGTAKDPGAAQGFKAAMSAFDVGAGAVKGGGEQYSKENTAQDEDKATAKRENALLNSVDNLSDRIGASFKEAANDLAAKIFEQWRQFEQEKAQKAFETQFQKAFSESGGVATDKFWLQQKQLQEQFQERSKSIDTSASERAKRYQGK